MAKHKAKITTNKHTQVISPSEPDQCRALIAGPRIGRTYVSAKSLSRKSSNNAVESLVEFVSRKNTFILILHKATKLIFSTTNSNIFQHH